MTGEPRDFREPLVRRGLTLMEVGIALAVLAVCMLLVMQVGYLSLLERSRRHMQRVALECAANVLETARAQPWESLTPEWAAAQGFSDLIRDELPQATLEVTVEPEVSQQLTRRVTVSIRCKHSDDVEFEAARLVALVSARSVAKGGAR